MAEVDEMAQDLTVRLAAPADVRAMGERHRARRRAALGVGAAIAVAALGAGSWVTMAADPQRGAVPATGVTVPATPNPYVSGDTIHMVPAADLPLNSTLHWKKDTGTGDSRDTNDPLPSAGLHDVCGVVVNGVIGPGDDYQGGTGTYTGKGGALARHRIYEYDTAAYAAAKVKAEQEYLTEQCGLTLHGSGATAYYSGTTGRIGHRMETSVPESGGSQTLRVTVAQYGRWVSVIEVQRPAAE
jgi:hypothetical protein